VRDQRIIPKSRSTELPPRLRRAKMSDPVELMCVFIFMNSILAVINLKTVSKPG